MVNIKGGAPQDETMTNKKDEQYTKEFILILMSSIVGALLSLYANNNYSKLTNLEFSSVFDLIIKTVSYIVIVGLILLILFYGAKLATFLFNIIFKPAWTSLSFIYNKYVGKHFKNNTLKNKKGKYFDSEKFYKKNPNPYNLVFILILIYLYYKYKGYILSPTASLILIICLYYAVIYYGYLSIKRLVRK